MSILLLLPVCMLFYSYPAPEFSPSAVEVNDFTIVMETESLRNGKPDKDGSIVMSVTCAGNLSGMKFLQDGGEMLTILDAENRTIITVTTDKRGERQAMKLPLLNIGSRNMPESDVTYTATDQTKQIIGYTARKYLFTSKESEGEAWIAEVAGVDWSRLADAVVGGRKGSSRMYMPTLEGYSNPVALESHSSSRGGKTTSNTYVRSIETGGKADLSLVRVPEGVELTDMTGFLRN